MGLTNLFRGEFLDAIEYEDQSNKILVKKYQREGADNNELKQGSKVVVREGQAAAFIRQGQLADVMGPGTYTLNTGNFPILSKLEAFPFFGKSPVIADLYFISTRLFIGQNWGTKNPIIKRDANMNLARIRAHGQYAFRVLEPAVFMMEIVGSMGLTMTYNILQYLNGVIIEAFSTTVGESAISIIDLATNYRQLGGSVLQLANDRGSKIGITFTDVLIENVSLPEEVERMIDEQSGIGLASRDMDTFMQYQTARAMRDAAKQKGGLAGLGAGMALGNKMVQNMNSGPASSTDNRPLPEQLRELKSLLDEGILTQEEFNNLKANLLKAGQKNRF